MDVLRRERQQRNVARALQGDGEHALVACTGTGLAARLDLASVGDVAAQAGRLFVVDVLDLVDAEGADTPATEATAAICASLRARLAAIDSGTGLSDVQFIDLLYHKTARPEHPKN